jgi:hypothetical protein
MNLITSSKILWQLSKFVKLLKKLENEVENWKGR